MLPPPANGVKHSAHAEMRMATEIDAGQARGEVARPGGDRDSIARSSGNGNQPTLSNLGVSSQRLSEWRETRDAGEPAASADLAAPPMRP